MNWHFNNKVPVGVPILARIHPFLDSIIHPFSENVGSYFVMAQKESDNADCVTELDGEQSGGHLIKWIEGWIEIEGIEQDWNNSITSHM